MHAPACTYVRTYVLYIRTCTYVHVTVSTITITVCAHVPPPAAPSAPRSLVAIAITSDSVSLQWAEPLPPNGIIRRYIVQYYLTSSPSNIVQYNDSVLETSVTVEGLVPFTEYTFRVSAVTVSEGPSTEITNTTAESGERWQVFVSIVVHECTQAQKHTSHTYSIHIHIILCIHTLYVQAG